MPLCFCSRSSKQECFKGNSPLKYLKQIIFWTLLYLSPSLPLLSFLSKPRYKMSIPMEIVTFSFWSRREYKILEQWDQEGKSVWRLNYPTTYSREKLQLDHWELWKQRRSLSDPICGTKMQRYVCTSSYQMMAKGYCPCAPSWKEDFMYEVWFTREASHTLWMRHQ